MANSKKSGVLLTHTPMNKWRSRPYTTSVEENPNDGRKITDPNHGSGSTFNKQYHANLWCSKSCSSNNGEWELGCKGVTSRGLNSKSRHNNAAIISCIAKSLTTASTLSTRITHTNGSTFGNIWEHLLPCPGEEEVPDFRVNNATLSGNQVGTISHNKPSSNRAKGTTTNSFSTSITTATADSMTEATIRETAIELETSMASSRMTLPSSIRVSGSTTTNDPLSSSSSSTSSCSPSSPWTRRPPPLVKSPSLISTSSTSSYYRKRHQNFLATISLKWYFFLWHFFCILAPCLSLSMTEVRIPKHIMRHEDAALGCKYDLDGESLYSVKWYKDGFEFYRYVPRDMPPGQVFPLPGVDVDLQNSTDNVVVLRRVTLQSTGRYRCEVSGEAPSFQTVSGHEDMIVVVTPSAGPQITGGKPRYQIGDLVSVNCTSAPSKPICHLSWLINGVHANRSFLRYYEPKIVGREGLEVATLGLEFRVRG
ncbi:uncharacterized protein LOC142224523 [Haematobia irritans]|uniref:uncharacterized protein LOC142224523 n=1 Tax=Haematobia irritans TaxID=7368 RepID=UPI003F50049E